MQIIGRVTKLKGGVAVVKTQRPAACGSCANAAVCGKKDLKVFAVNGADVDARIGDVVTVEVEDDAKALGALAYLFLTPVAIFLLGCGLFTVQPYAAAVCAPLFAAYLVLLKRINRRFRAHARITGKCDKEPDCYQGEQK